MIIFPSDIEKVRAKYRRKLQELCKREKEILSKLYAAYYLSQDESESTAIENQILKILEMEGMTTND